MLQVLHRELHRDVMGICRVKGFRLIRNELQKELISRFFTIENIPNNIYNRWEVLYKMDLLKNYKGQ